MRGLAIIAVICSHLIWPSTTLDAIDRVMFNGWVGVDLFFVLSGFLITGILIDARGASGYFRRFYVRRALRIFPIYYLLLVLVFIVAPAIARGAHHGIDQSYRFLLSHEKWYWPYMVNVLQVKNPPAVDRQWTGHLWSLSLEEQFYLVWPALVWLVPRRRLAMVFGGLAAAAVCWRVWLASHGNPFAAYELMPARIDSLAVGGFIAAVIRDADGRAALARWYPWMGAVAGVGALALHARFGDQPLSYYMVTVGCFVNAIAAAMLIAGLVIGRHRWLGWLSAGPLRWIGRVSYGAYLWHIPLLTLLWPVRNAIHGWSVGGSLRNLAAHCAWAAIGMAVIFAVSAASYASIEQPFLRLKDRFAMRDDGSGRVPLMTSSQAIGIT